MSQLSPLKTFTQLTFGERVDKTAEELTGGGVDQSLFTIAGGRVLITAIIGEITVAASGATNLQLESVPTTGTAAVLGTVVAAAALEAGTLLVNAGPVGSALYGVSAGVAQGPSISIIAPIGAIKMSSSAAETISTKWSITYVPLDDGAYIEAA